MVRCTDIDGEPVGHSGNKDAHERHKQLRKDSLALRGKRPSAKAYSANFYKSYNSFIMMKRHTPPRRGEPPVTDKRKEQSAE